MELSTDEAPVTLNVGGKSFTTTRRTLMCIPYFSALSSGWQVPEFIDRSPEAFDAILNHARDSRYAIPTKYAPDASYFGYEVERFEDLPPLTTTSLAGHTIEPDETLTVSPQSVSWTIGRSTEADHRFNNYCLLSFTTSHRDLTVFDQISLITVDLHGLNPRNYNLTDCYWLNRAVFSATTLQWFEYQRAVHGRCFLLLDLRNACQLCYSSFLVTTVRFNVPISQCRFSTFPAKILCREGFVSLVYHGENPRESVPASNVQWDPSCALLLSSMLGIDCHDYVYTFTKQMFEKYEMAKQSNISTMFY